MVLFVRNNQSGAPTILIFLFDRYLAILIYEVSEKQYKFIVHIYVGFPCTRKLLNLRDPWVLESTDSLGSEDPMLGAIFAHARFRVE
jgi:hypothetical protein